MRVVVLTRHALVVFAKSVDGGEQTASPRVILRVAPSGQVARVRTRSVAAADLAIDGVSVPLSTVSYEPTIDGLPPPVGGIVYFVSRITAEAANRGDLVFAADEVRDRHNRIIGCHELAQFAVSEQRPI